MSPQCEAIAHAVMAAGSSGIALPVLRELCGTSSKTMRQQMGRIRAAGILIYASWRPDGGIYFAEQDWKLAADAAWREEVKQAKRAKAIRDTKLRCIKRSEQRAAMRAKMAKPAPPPEKRKAGPKLTEIQQHIKGTPKRGQQPLELVGSADRGKHEPKITAKTKVTIAATCLDQRYTVHELPAGYVSALDPREARPWTHAL